MYPAVSPGLVVVVGSLSSPKWLECSLLRGCIVDAIVEKAQGGVYMCITLIEKQVRVLYFFSKPTGRRTVQ